MAVAAGAKGSEQVSRFDEMIAAAAAELMEWEEWLDSLSPEDRAAELAAIEAGIGNTYNGGPCVQAPAHYRKGGQ